MATSDIVISFKDMNGDPATCMRVIISDGTTVLEFNNVTSISETVPSNATYRFVWQSAGYDTMDQIPLELDENQSYSFNFYCLDRSVVVQHERPYILLEEDGANANLEWNWDNEEKQLDINLTAEMGKIVEYVVWIDTDLSDEPKWECAYPHPWPKPPIETWGVCTPWNVFIDGRIPKVADQVEGSIKFNPVSSDETFVGFRKAMYKGFIVDTAVHTPLLSTLKDSNNVTISPQALWPQYAVGEGYYSIIATQIPSEYVALTLPLKVELGKASLFELYPPKVSELAEYTFDIAGEYYHNRAGVSSVDHNAPQQTVTAYVVVNGHQGQAVGYFGYFALPSGTLATEIMVTLTDSTEITLSETQDYILTQTALFNLYCVRVPIDAESVKLSY